MKSGDKEIMRRPSAEMTYVADGVFAIGVAAILFPSSPIIWTVAAVLGTIPAWVRHFSGMRVAERRFVPDPRRPDFTALAKAMASSVADMAVEKSGEVEWTLCPYCSQDGCFRPYSIDISPASGMLSVGTRKRSAEFKTAVAIRPDIAIPVTVFDRPVSMRICASARRGEVFFRPSASRWLSWGHDRNGGLRLQTMKLGLALPPILMSAFPDCALFAPERVVAAMVVIAAVTLRGGR